MVLGSQLTQAMLHPPSYSLSEHSPLRDVIPQKGGHKLEIKMDDQSANLLQTELHVFPIFVC